MGRPYGALLISRGNSARCPVGQALVNRHGKRRPRASGAAVASAGDTEPLSLAVLGHLREALRRQAWHELTRPAARVPEFVLAVRNRTSRDAVPVWPGGPIAPHRRYPDASDAVGHRRREDVRTLSAIARRMRLLMQVPLARLDAMPADTICLEVAAAEAGRSCDHAAP